MSKPTYRLTKILQDADYSDRWIVDMCNTHTHRLNDIDRFLTEILNEVGDEDMDIQQTFPEIFTAIRKIKTKLSIIKIAAEEMD